MPGTLPAELYGMQLEDGVIGAKVLREMIFYKSGFTADEHDALIELYLRHCPTDRNQRFKIPEFIGWSSVAEPWLTASARQAQAHNKPLAHFEAVRRRIAERRWFFSMLWDGLNIEVPEGSWSLDIQYRRADDKTWSGYFRFLMPIGISDDTHLAIARDVIDTVPFISGHGGYCFTFRPERKFAAFDLIYPRAQRFKGIDIEDLPKTLSHMRTQLKPPCWLNVVGHDQNVWDTSLLQQLCALPETSEARVSHGRFGTLVQLSERPNVFDINSGDFPPVSYKQYDAAIAKVRLHDIDAFSGQQFESSPEVTREWLARYSF